MFKYRDHRGMLDESMDTEQEFDCKKDFINYLQKIVNKYGMDNLDCNKITIEPYGFDDRIGWDTYIVFLGGWGVFGFTDRQIKI